MTHGSLNSVVLLMFCTMLIGTTRSCLPFEYVLWTDIGEECCPKCIPGHRVKTDCTEFQSTSCTACDGGTFMDKYTGEKQCFQCLICSEGAGLRQIISCKFDRNTVCAPLEGFFCVSGSADRCVAAQRHSTCRPGQYINRAGTSSTDTVCGDCSEGTFSDGTFTSCQVHTQCSRLQQPGTIYADSVCQEGLTAGEVAGVVIGILTASAICVALYLLRKRLRCKNRKAREHLDENGTTVQALVENADAPPPQLRVPTAEVPRDDALLHDGHRRVTPIKNEAPAVAVDFDPRL